MVAMLSQIFLLCSVGRGKRNIQKVLFSWSGSAVLLCTAGKFKFSIEIFFERLQEGEKTLCL